MISLIDLHAHNSLAKSVRREGIELAGTTVGAVTVDELHAVDFPIGHDHGLLSGELLAASIANRTPEMRWRGHPDK